MGEVNSEASVSDGFYQELADRRVGFELVVARSNTVLDLGLGASQLFGSFVDSRRVFLEALDGRQPLTGSNQLLHSRVSQLVLNVIDEPLHQLDGLVRELITGFWLPPAGGQQDRKGKDQRENGSLQHGAEARHRQPNWRGSRLIDRVDDAGDDGANRPGGQAEDLAG